LKLYNRIITLYYRNSRWQRNNRSITSVST